MADESALRFRRAYWAALRELDNLRLQMWERSNLTLPQLRVLFQVRNTPGITTAELARTLGTTVSTASGLVIKLEERGLIARHQAPDDRRREPLSLTPGGVVLVGGLSDTTRPFLEGIARRLGDGIDDASAVLEAVAAAAVAERLAAEPASSEPAADAAPSQPAAVAAPSEPAADAAPSQPAAQGPVGA
jgi:DNA-binding MarR family transcriptional regulator